MEQVRLTKELYLPLTFFYIKSLRLPIILCQYLVYRDYSIFSNNL